MLTTRRMLVGLCVHWIGQQPTNPQHNEQPHKHFAKHFSLLEQYLERLIKELNKALFVGVRVIEYILHMERPRCLPIFDLPARCADRCR